MKAYYEDKVKVAADEYSTFTPNHSHFGNTELAYVNGNLCTEYLARRVYEVTCDNGDVYVYKIGALNPNMMSDAAKAECAERGIGPYVYLDDACNYYADLDALLEAIRKGTAIFAKESFYYKGKEDNSKQPEDKQNQYWATKGIDEWLDAIAFTAELNDSTFARELLNWQNLHSGQIPKFGLSLDEFKEKVKPYILKYGKETKEQHNIKQEITTLEGIVDYLHQREEARKNEPKTLDELVREEQRRGKVNPDVKIRVDLI